MKMASFFAVYMRVCVYRTYNLVEYSWNQSQIRLCSEALFRYDVGNEVSLRVHNSSDDSTRPDKFMIN